MDWILELKDAVFAARIPGAEPFARANERPRELLETMQDEYGRCIFEVHRLER